MAELIKSISRSEWRFIVLMSLVMIFLTGLPYLVGYLATPAGYVYDGLNSLTPGDNPIYYSYINQVKNGSWLLKDLFTGEYQSLGMLNVFWLIAGLTARVFSISPIFTFHLLRLMLIPLFVIVAYLFIGLFFAEIKIRKLSLIFLLFSSGLGGYLIGTLNNLDLDNLPGFGTPNDIWIPESITYLTLLKSPHFIASLMLMFLVFILMLLAFAKNRWRYSLTAGIIALVYFNFHPFYIPIVFGALGLYLFVLILKAGKILWPLVGHYLLLVIISGFSIAYHFWLLSSSPVIAQRAAQNITLAPPLVFMLIGYGFLWALGLLGIIWLAKKRQFNNHFLFLLCLLAVSILLIILPNQFQSRYAQGLHFPLVIFSVAGWLALKDWGLKNKKNWSTLVFDNKYLLVIVFFFALCFTNFFNLSRDIYYFTQKPAAVFNYFYLSQNFIEGLNQLNNLPPGAVLANSIDKSLFIPAFSYQQVYLAHGIETINFPVKLLFSSWFWAGNDNKKSRLEFLANSNIGYLFFVQSQKKSGDLEPDSQDYLRLVYQNSEVKIYQVLK